MQSYQFISSPAEQSFVQVFREARDSLFVVSPYIKDYGVKLLQNNAKCKKLHLLTNLDLANVTSTSFDIESVVQLWDKFDLKISSLGKLHAKIYIADKKIGLVTSANLTHGGLRENYEFGILLNDEKVVTGLFKEATTYFGLGNIFDRIAIEDIQTEISEIRELQKKIAKTAEALRLERVLKQKEESLQTKILINRSKGKTVNSIFSETIQFLLGKLGPLSTAELHPLIQNMHPDICDDTIDRVINGQHFGKKWKHMVRNAQQSLKQNSFIQLKDGKWRLTEPYNQDIG